jgi:hypothetical protein
MQCILYRAVTQREYDDILKQNNRFRCIPRGLEAKQFAVTEDCGHYYGKEIVMAIDQVKYILVRVVLNIKEICNDIMRLDECNAVSIDMRDLERFNNAIISVVPVNLN